MKLNSELKTAVVYYRVSTEKQATRGVSLAYQKRTCCEFAERNDMDILKIFHDDGASAKTTDRHVLQEMLAYCNAKKKKIDCLIVYKVDRLSRDVNDYTNILVFLNKLQIRLVSTTESIDTTPTGKFIGNIMATSAQLDNDMRSERITACMLEKIKHGHWCWKAPVGYLNKTTEDDRKTIIVDKDKNHLIKLAFEKFSTGLYALEDVRQLINKRGLRNSKGNKISPQLMHNIIVNPFYYGMLKVKDNLYKGNQEKTIPEETFNKCQQFLKRGSKGKNISRRKENDHFPLRNFAICSYCGRPLTAAFSTGRLGGKFPYYRCNNNKCTSKKSIAKKEIENDFLNLLKQITPKKKFLDIFKPIILEVWDKSYHDINKRRNILLKTIENLEKEKEKLIDMKKKDLLDDDDFKASMQKTKQKIQEKKIILSETKAEKFNPEEAIDYVFNFITDIPKFWTEADCQQKIRLQGLIFTERPVYLYPKFETPKISIVLKQKHVFESEKSTIVPPRGIEPLFKV